MPFIVQFQYVTKGKSCLLFSVLPVPFPSVFILYNVFLKFSISQYFAFFYFFIPTPFLKQTISPILSSIPGYVYEHIHR